MSSHKLFPAILLAMVLAPAVSMSQTPTPAQKESWWQKFLRVTGVSATPSKQKGSHTSIESGFIWLANLEEKTGSPLTSEGGYRSPIFVNKDQSILALKNDEIVTIPVLGGRVQTLFTIKGAVKLVGETMDDPDKVLMLAEDQDKKPVIVIVSLTSGGQTNVPYETSSTEGEAMFAHLAGWNRVYCNTEVSVAETIKKDPSGRGTRKSTDVFVKRAYRDPINVSNCNGINCGQPSLSQDGTLVAFIKSEQ